MIAHSSVTHVIGQCVTHVLGSYWDKLQVLNSKYQVRKTGYFTHPPVPRQPKPQPKLDNSEFRIVNAQFD
jgi:hypothetical protein